MKKWLISLSILSFLSNAVSAQTDAQAKSILAQTSKKYRSYNSVKADFTFTINNEKAKIMETQSGTLFVKSKENKYKVSMEDQDLISDGKSKWTYLKDDKEVQLSNVDNKDDALNPAKIFTLYEKGYKYTYTGDSKLNGKVNYTIELAPLDIKQSFFKIRLSIDKATKNLTQATIFDRNGSRYTYAIKTFTPNTIIPESTFMFDSKKNPGVEVVDLR